MRIQPVMPPYDETVEQQLTRWMPPGANVEPLMLFRVLARHPHLMDAMRPLGAYMLGRHNQTELADRELIINRVCGRCGCEYEWGVHVTAFGAAAGLSQEKLTGTYSAASDAEIWSERESLLLKMVDELQDTSHISDELWAALSKIWTDEQLLEMIALAGWYHVIAYIANATQLAPEKWAQLAVNGSHFG